MAITQADVLGVFSQVAALKNSDQFLIITANQDGTVSATKITAELVRAYLNEGFTVTVGDDGYLYIGGVKQDALVEGITPQMERRADGIYCSTDNGETWFVVAYFTDFSKSLRVVQTNTLARILPNVLNVWGSVSSLTITFSPGNAGDMNEYMLEFTVSGGNFTLNLPTGIRWSSRPEWMDGVTYQVSIVDGLAVYGSW